MNINGKLITEYNALTKQLLKIIVKNEEGENVIFSPLSVYFLLSMLLDSTAGQSREEIIKAICQNLSHAKTEETIKTILSEINSSGKVKSAMAVLTNQEMVGDIYNDFRSIISNKYEGMIFDSVNAADDAQKWISQKTDGLIKGPALESLSDAYALSMISSVAFKDRWLNDYEDTSIKNDDFTNNDGSLSRVVMMDSTENSYLENDFFQGFSKPYKDERYSFVALLPKDPTMVISGELIDKIDFGAIVNDGKIYTLDVKIPEFNIRSERDLQYIMNAMGIKQCFEDAADFSPVSNIPISGLTALNSAMIDVNREGTWAFDISMICCLGRPPRVRKEKKIIHLNRPFVYAIILREANLPVFAGIVNHLGNPDDREAMIMNEKMSKSETLHKRIIEGIQKAEHMTDEQRGDFHIRADEALKKRDCKELKGIFKEMLAFGCFSEL